MKIGQIDFQLKYDDAVLVAHVYVCAEQDVSKLQKNVIRSARGPRSDAFAAWTEIYPPGRKLGVEADGFGDQRAAVEEFLRSSRRDVVVLHLCINTDADPRKIGENLQRAARGPRFDDVTCVVQLYDGSRGRKVWDIVQEVARRAHADPAARPFTP